MLDRKKVAIFTYCIRLKHFFRQFVSGLYHCGHSLHGRILLVHVELSQIVGQWTFVLELRGQALISL